MDRQVIDQKLESLRRCLLLAQQNVLPSNVADQLKKSVGFRNIVREHLQDFTEFAKAVADRAT